MVLSAISHPSTPIGQNWPTSHAQLVRFKHRHRLLTGGSVSRDHACCSGPEPWLSRTRSDGRSIRATTLGPAPAARQFATPQPDDLL